MLKVRCLPLVETEMNRNQLASIGADIDRDNFWEK